MKNLILTVALLGAIPIASRTEIVAAPQKMKAMKWPTFRQNMAKKAAPEIKAIQLLLRSRGFYTRQIDGVFGAQTTKSVRAFQRKNGLKADGIVASQTFPKLMKTLKRGDRGDAVRALQIVLNDTLQQSEVHGVPPVKVDGFFGFQTEEAVRVHQRVLEIKENGIVNNFVWCALFGVAPNYQP